MATPPGVPPLRVLEALGIGLSPTGEMTEAVTAEGAYYLERILLVAPHPRAGLRRGFFLWGVCGPHLMECRWDLQGSPCQPISVPAVR